MVMWQIFYFYTNNIKLFETQNKEYLDLSELKSAEFSYFVNFM